MKFVVPAVEYGHPNFGKARPCPVCHSYLASSRLTEGERAASLTGMADRDERLLFMARQMLADPFGFLSLYGGTGTGKSDVLVALVADFCRDGKEAQYWHGGDIAVKLSDKSTQGMWLSYFSELPVLCIEELDDLRQKLAAWDRSLLSSLIDARYRQRATHVTLLTMQAHPTLWCGEQADIMSRIRDGRFHREMGDDDVPGLLQVDGPDMRLRLRR